MVSMFDAAIFDAGVGNNFFDTEEKQGVFGLTTILRAVSGLTTIFRKISGNTTVLRVTTDNTTVRMTDLT